MSERGDRDFLSRWSRRKRDGAEELAPDAPETPAIAEDDRPDAEILADHGLPDPEDIGPDDDVSGFMKSAIPQRLRNRALRKLWLRNPLLANLDDLIDYGEDYSDAAMVVENMASAWQAGRGYLPEEPAEVPPQAPPDAQEAEPAEADDAPGPPHEALEEHEPPATQPGAGAESATAEPDPPITAPRRRRMAFRLPGADDGS